MPKHEFGIMNASPTMTQEYNAFEPEKFHCISVDDAYIEPLSKELSVVPCYWHSLKQSGNGLAYCGISLVPPESLEKFLSVIADKGVHFAELERLLKKARQENKYVIHYGI